MCLVDNGTHGYREYVFPIVVRRRHKWGLWKTPRINVEKGFDIAASKAIVPDVYMRSQHRCRLCCHTI